MSHQKVKIKLSQFTDSNGDPRYNVIEIRNTTSLKARDILTEIEVKALISIGIEVVIVPSKNIYS